MVHVQNCPCAVTAPYLEVLGALGAVLHSPTLLQRWTEVCCYGFLLLVQVAVHLLQPCQKLAPLNRCSICIMGGDQAQDGWKLGLGSIPLVSAKPAASSSP